MRRLFKKVKVELFFIWRLFDWRYTPSAKLRFDRYFQYFKNRFFYHSALEKLQKFEFEASDDFEMHLLCQESDIWMAIWALRSFLFYSDLKPRQIVIHDDGSMCDNSARLFESKFSNLKVISRKVADHLILDGAGLKGKVLDYRSKGFPLILKLLDSILLSNTKRIIVADADIIFFSRPNEIINFIKEPQSKDGLFWAMDKKAYDLTLVRDSYWQKYKIRESGIEYNMGCFNIFDKTKITKEKIEEFFDNCVGPVSHYFIEACGWLGLTGQLDFKLLPVGRYIIKGPVRENTIAKHFTSARRQELYAYAIDQVRSAMEK